MPRLFWRVAIFLRVLLFLLDEVVDGLAGVHTAELLWCAQFRQAVVVGAVAILRLCVFFLHIFIWSLHLFFFFNINGIFFDLCCDIYLYPGKVPVHVDLGLIIFVFLVLHAPALFACREFLCRFKGGHCLFFVFFCDSDFFFGICF